MFKTIDIVMLGIVVALLMLMLYANTSPKPYTALRHAKVLNIAFDVVGKRIDTITELNDLDIALNKVGYTMINYYKSVEYVKHNDKLILTKSGWELR